MRRTKIICTIGPASKTEFVLDSLIKNGMNITRLNFSHGTHKEHKILINRIRKVAKKNKKPIVILADLQGPKIRVGDLDSGGVELKNNTTIIFTTGKKEKNKISVTYNKLHKDVKREDRIFLDDGLIEVKVERVKGKDMICKVINGGQLFSHKGMNFPNSKISLSSLTNKDKDDLMFAMSMKVDYIAISFVRSPKDIKELKLLIDKNVKKLKVKKPKIIVKIEKQEALQNFIKILSVSDSVMIARGDLGIETPAEDVPLRQKEIILLCRQAGKPVIVATQMLDSMIRNPRPTRAEVSDVANAVIDGVDAVMLSGESATGKYPKETVEMMKKIIVDVEGSSYDDFEISESIRGLSKNDKIGKSVHILVKKTGISQIIDLSGEGLYQYVSKWRPEVDILVNSKENAPNLYWGVRTFDYNSSNVKNILNWLHKQKFLKKKKVILITKGGKIEVIE